MKSNKNTSKRTINKKYRISYIIYKDTQERYDFDDCGNIEKRSQNLTMPILHLTSPPSPDSEVSSPPSVSSNFTISTQPFSLNRWTQPPHRNLNETARRQNLNDGSLQANDNLSSFLFQFDDDDNDDNDDDNFDDDFLF